MDSELNDLLLTFLVFIAIGVLALLLSGCTIRVISKPQYDVERERTQIIESYKKGHTDGITDAIDAFDLDEQNNIENTY